MGRLAVIGYAQETNLALVDAWRERGIEAELLGPAQALGLLRPGDIALGRLDVLASLDGVEPGLQALHWLELVGVTVLNRADTLEAAHDKLVTEDRLAAARIPRPPAHAVETLDDLAAEPLPFVVKPRFGSWGRDVFRCRTRSEQRAAMAVVATRPWFRYCGAVVEELMETPGHDLRILVAGGRVVGSAMRVAAPGEWRTNVSLGGSIGPTRVPDEAEELAIAAAAAVDGDFVGIDVLPGKAGFTVMEVNGAVEFDDRYATPGVDVYIAIADALALTPASAPVAQPAPAT